MSETQDECSGARYHGKPFRYCPVRGCNWGEPTVTDTAPTLSIDSDPEFFHGLSFLGQSVSAQMRDRGVLVVNDLPNIHVTTLTPSDARRLRDLLNLATARGFL